MTTPNAELSPHQVAAPDTSASPDEPGEEAWDPDASTTPDAYLPAHRRHPRPGRDDLVHDFSWLGAPLSTTAPSSSWGEPLRRVEARLTHQLAHEVRAISDLADANGRSTGPSESAEQGARRSGRSALGGAYVPWRAQPILAISRRWSHLIHKACDERTVFELPPCGDRRGRSHLSPRSSTCFVESHHVLVTRPRFAPKR